MNKTAINSTTKYLIQLSKNNKAYETQIVLMGDLTQAIHIYKQLKLGKNCKKRLISPQISKKPIAQEIA